MTVASPASVDHRWSSTRYNIGDTVTFVVGSAKKPVWEIYQIHLIKSHDGTIKPMYSLRRSYIAINKKKKWTYQWVPASRIRLHERLETIKARKDKEKAERRRAARRAARNSTI